MRFKITLLEALFRPLRTYSAGMRLRIACAVATFDNPEILLMDEFVCAGDENFTTRSKNRIGRMVGVASTLVLASHSPQSIRENGDGVLGFDTGKIVFDGNVEAGLVAHQNK
jgi:ABC-type polysaccharide/polyol phosphate transport system ATPase subunit